MRRRQFLGVVGGTGLVVTSGCTSPFESSGTALAAVFGSNSTNEDYTIEAAVEFDGELVAEGVLELARHRTGDVSPYDSLDCTWPTDERGVFTVTAHLVERDETHRRSTDDEYAPDDTCQQARMSVEENDLTVHLWGCDSRDRAPAGYNCESGDFDWE